MNSHTGYAKSNDGRIHLVSAINPEFTLCGNAFDGESGDGDDQYAWKDCEKQNITCKQCAVEIINCKGVKISIETKDRP